MSSKVPPDPAAVLTLVPRSLLLTSLALLVLGAVLNGTGHGAGGPETLSWVATAWALLAPVLAVWIRGQGLLSPPPPTTGSADEPLPERLRRTLIFFAILESGVVLAAIALIASPSQWPLFAALLPLAVMILNLPPRA